MKPNCRLCKADAKKQTVRADFVYGASEQGKYKFYECSRCRVIYLFPFLTEEQEKLFYKKEFENFMSSRSKDRDWKSTENHIKSNQDQVIRRMRFLKSHLTPNKNILEIGCSSGFMLDAFKDLGLNCYAVEPSIQFLKFLTQEKNYKAYESLESLHQNCNINFDLIVHFFVFEHIANPFEFLQKIYNLLSKNGVMIFEIPCSTDPLTSLYNIPAFEKFYWSIVHHYYYNPASVSYVLDKLGLKYEILPEQRYDLSNHITWMMDSLPGGQGRFSIFSQETIATYKKDLMDNWQCDTMIVKIYK